MDCLGVQQTQQTHQSFSGCVEDDAVEILNQKKKADLTTDWLKVLNNHAPPTLPALGSLAFGLPLKAKLRALAD